MGWVGSAILVTSLLQSRLDVTPGEFVYRRSGLSTDRGFRSVVAPRAMPGADASLTGVGFRRRGEDRILDLVTPG